MSPGRDTTRIVAIFTRVEFHYTRFIIGYRRLRVYRDSVVVAHKYDLGARNEAFGRGYVIGRRMRT